MKAGKNCFSDGSGAQLFRVARSGLLGETFVIERGGEPVCEMSHVTPPRLTGADLLTLLHSLPKPDTGYWDAVEEITKQTPVVPESPLGPYRPD